MTNAPMADVHIFINGKRHLSKIWGFVPRVGDEIMMHPARDKEKQAFKVTRVVYGCEGPDTPRDWQSINQYRYGADDMTNEQLSELPERVTPGELKLDFHSKSVLEDNEGNTLIHDEYGLCDSDFLHLAALAPSLARRVLAAEKMVEALGDLMEAYDYMGVTGSNVDECTKALAEYEAAK